MSGDSSRPCRLLLIDRSTIPPLTPVLTFSLTNTISIFREYFSFSRGIVQSLNILGADSTVGRASGSRCRGLWIETCTCGGVGSHLTGLSMNKTLETDTDNRQVPGSGYPNLVNGKKIGANM